MALLDETSIVLYGNRNVVVGLATFLDMIAMKLQHEEWQVSQEQEKKVQMRHDMTNDDDYVVKPPTKDR